MYQQQSLLKSDVDVNSLKNWEVNSNTSDYNLARIKSEIELGNTGQGGINLKPFYQREYKFTRKDESLLIESLLGGIPVPVIYLASDISKVPHISNVIDGQHRLLAVYRFLNNEFPLTGLKKFKQLEKCYFNDLHTSIQNKLLYQISLTLEFIHVQDDPELELEIFTRYNQGTNPLTSQEIRHVVFSSKFNDWLIKKIDKWKTINYIKDIFNISSKRFGDKTTHQEFYVLFGIYKNLSSPNYSNQTSSKNKHHNIKIGINQDYYSSTNYVTEFMHHARKLDDIESTNLISECNNFFNKFILFLRDIYHKNGILYPLSKEIYQQVNTKNYKMQTSILMIMTSVFYWINENNISYSSTEQQAELRKVLLNGFNNSEFPTTTSSTTEPKFLIRTISTIIDNLESHYNLG
ncbi:MULTISPECIES: DUF262 domain-containing protein [unclassified Clostridium]|jgi:hypothetical protein|uniref:DUF262 domain-containing protein n=1 Tax=unclassified Clostridium TaxID=2614128 RepID=UPI003F92E07A